jgi:hypothetical protein
VAAGLGRYGLTENPFLVKPADPSAASEKHLVADVDGFKRTGEFAAEIQRAAEKKTPCFFLVVGRSGAGRTTYANYLLAIYREARMLQTFVHTDGGNQDYDDTGLLKRIVLELYNAVDREKVPIDSGLRDQLLSIPFTIGDDPAIVRPRFKILMRQLSEALAARNAGYGLLMDDVLDIAVVKALYEVFVDSQTMVVFTVEDYSGFQESVVRPYRASVPDGSKVELHDIVAEDVEKLILDRWQRMCATVEPPFEEGAIQSGLATRPRPVGKVMSIMAGALDDRAGKLGDGDPWPEDRTLAFSAQFLRQKVDEFARNAG